MAKLKDKVAAVVKIKENLHKPIYDLDINKYHGMTGTYSSTQFKDLLEDEDVFIAKHIKKEKEREESAAFDVGQVFHTGILEPHKMRKDCVVYSEGVRRGKKWEAFREKHRGKAIVTESQMAQADGLIRAVKDSPVAQKYLDGDAEVSIITEINIVDGQILAPHYGKLLTPGGWVDGPKKRIKEAFVIFVRVRADMLGGTYISDLKSTTGNAKSNKTMREKISNYHYDLSAALYLDMFGLFYPAIRDFVWIFASKDLYNSRSYLASQNNILVGRAKYSKAMFKMAECAGNNWQSVDYLDTLEPLPHELEHLREKDTDLL